MEKEKTELEKARISKKERIELRISSLEKAIIKKKADHAGLSVADFFRKSALNQKISYKLTSEEIAIYKDLHKFHRNFEAITNLYKKGLPQLAEEVRATAEAVRNHLKKLQ